METYIIAIMSSIFGVIAGAIINPLISYIKRKYNKTGVYVVERNNLPKLRELSKSQVKKR